jgi:hypothetical protein
MALYLKANLLKVTKEVHATVDLTKLGKTQLNRVHKYLTTGNLSGEGVPAQIALGILRQTNSPYIHMRAYACQHNRLPQSAIDELNVVIDAIRMAVGDDDGVREMAHEMLSGYFSYYYLRRLFDFKAGLYQPYLEHINSITIQPSDAVSQIAEAIKARTMTEVTLTLHTGE